MGALMAPSCHEGIHYMIHSTQKVRVAGDERSTRMPLGCIALKPVYDRILRSDRAGVSQTPGVVSCDACPG